MAELTKRERKVLVALHRADGADSDIVKELGYSDAAVAEALGISNAELEDIKASLEKKSLLTRPDEVYIGMTDTITKPGEPRINGLGREEARQLIEDAKPWNKVKKASWFLCTSFAAKLSTVLWAVLTSAITTFVLSYLINHYKWFDKP